MSNIRRVIARNTQESWQSIPHVTQFDEADITLIEEFRKANAGKIEGEGGKLTLTALLVKITGFALQRFPVFNSAIDIQGMKIIYHHNINVGIAVDTPKGLLVPVIRNADRKSISEISVELTNLSAKARDNKISIEELTGGTFTVSNLGGIGGTAFTPIIYKPQVAILGISRAVMKQVYVNNEFTGRLMLPLSLSYDHRIVDGADGARFLSWIRNAVEKPFGIMQ
jgi:pyruvate dehydrogenase E2 component (dihydrolipoamide acetyltransferase)